MRRAVDTLTDKLSDISFHGFPGVKHLDLRTHTISHVFNNIFSTGIPEHACGGGVVVRQSVTIEKYRSLHNTNARVRSSIKF